LKIILFVIYVPSKYYKNKKNGFIYFLYSGFCNYFVCSQHLRKKRKNKGSFDRICDTCEDKYLFESYMKYEMKAE
jgi:hypothetical protein